MKTQFEQGAANALRVVAQIVNLLCRRLAIGGTQAGSKVSRSFAGAHCQSAIQPTASRRYKQRHVALVITLILLSVITFMTVTFLVISRREGEQVDTTTQQNVAKFAADGITPAGRGASNLRHHGQDQK